MSQSYFSLEFLSQNYLWKLSTFCRYKGIYNSVCEECEKSVFIQTGHSSDSVSRVEQVARLSRKLTAWPDYIICPVVLQLSWPFSSLHASHVCHFGNLPIASQSRDPVSRLLCMHTFWVFFTLSHTHPLHNFYLNIGSLIVKIQANFVQNKTNTWLNKFNLTKIMKKVKLKVGLTDMDLNWRARLKISSHQWAGGEDCWVHKAHGPAHKVKAHIWAFFFLFCGQLVF